MRALDRLVAQVLASGRLPIAVALVIGATLLAALAAARYAQTVPFEQVVYGEGRSPLITALLESMGRDRTAVVVYLLERSWQALIFLTALSPVFLWVLGSTAVHAAARWRGARAAFLPLFVLFGYAAAAARVPPDLAALTVPVLAGPLGTVTTLAFGVIAWLALRRHYRFAPVPAFTTLVASIALFYVVPLLLILLAVTAIVVAAIVLEYVR